MSVTLPSLELLQRNSYEFTAQEYGPAVLIKVKEHLWHVKTITPPKRSRLDYPEPKLNKHGRDVEWQIVVQKELYEKQKKRDPSWILTIEDTDAYWAIHPDYYEAYLAGKAHEYEQDDDKPVYDNVETLLEEGKFERLVHWGDDGYLYSVEGKPVRRRIWIGYIDGRLQSGDGNYNLKPLLEHLKANPQCEDVTLMEIPYYNQDYPGQKAIELWFTPDEDQHIMLSATEDSMERFDVIREILEVEQFRVK